MKFERGKNINEAIGIGKMPNAQKIDSIHIAVKDPAVRKTEPDPFSGAPRIKNTIVSKRIRGKEVHQIFEGLSNKKFPWEKIFSLWPEHVDGIKENRLRVAFYILLEKTKSNTRGHNILRFHDCKGKDLYYDGKIYEIPPGNPEVSKSRSMSHTNINK